ncbi:carbohydrate ABC transporter substrate-binding protein, CUT1 family [Pyrobaculum sp. WP30]|nr:carbohydrate ABC transporter substrate-binding protein, CUT1 family [Pyrobaculum sp. WP30]
MSQEGKISRRQLFMAVGGAAVAAVAGGVLWQLSQPKPPTTTTQASATPQTTATPTTGGAAQGKLVILARSDYHQDAHDKALIPYFKERNPSVAVEYIPKGYNDLYQVAKLAMQRGAADYDVLYLDEPWVREFTQWAVPVDVDTTGYPPKLLEPVKAGNGLYAVPILGNFNFYFYRTDVLDQIGENKPKSMDDIMRIAETVQKRLAPKIYGFTGNFTVGQGSGAAGDAYALLLLTYGGAFFDPKDGVTPVLDSQEAVEALKTTKFFVKNGHPQITSWPDLRSIHESVYQGEAASGLVWNGWVQYVDDPQRSKVVGKVEVMPLPGRKGPVAHTGVWYYVVPKFSKNQETAKAFVKAVTSHEAQLKAQLVVNMPPTRATVFADAEVRRRNRLADSYAKIIEAGTPARTSPIWTAAQPRLNEVIARYFQDAVTAEEAVKQMHSILVEVSKKEGLI